MGTTLNNKLDIGEIKYAQVGPVPSQVALCLGAVLNDVENRVEVIAFVWVLPPRFEQSLGWFQRRTRQPSYDASGKSDIVSPSR